jgi:hypothetical protein
VATCNCKPGQATEVCRPSHIRPPVFPQRPTSLSSEQKRILVAVQGGWGVGKSHALAMLALILASALTDVIPSYVYVD